MTPAERYILLGLRLNRHVDGVVDAYYGPPELREEAESGDPVAADELAADGASLVADLEEGWLRDCAQGLQTFASVLAGNAIPYAEEVHLCYGVKPERIDKDVYREVHARLEELLPGEGSLGERREAWRTQNLVDPAKMMPVMHDLFAEVRRRTQELFGLPEGEEITLEEVHDEPWWAFNYYQGNRRSRIVVNVDQPTTYDDLLELCCHEGYPGHHTEKATKEVTLFEERGQLEESIIMIPTPQSVLAEGIAETAMPILGEDAREAALAILRKHGVEYDHERARAIKDALEPIRGLGVDVALLIHEDGADEEEAIRYGMEWGATTEARARQGVRFVTDPTWRSYVICYSAGGDLARAYHRGDPARFKRLLSENVRISELGSS